MYPTNIIHKARQGRPAGTQYNRSRRRVPEFLLFKKYQSPPPPGITLTPKERVLLWVLFPLMLRWALLLCCMPSGLHGIYSVCTMDFALRLAVLYISGLDQVYTPQLFYTCFYNHAHRLRLEKLLYIELSISFNGFFKPLLDPGYGFTSETAVARPFRKWNGKI
jgi:hypothetical protein